jgi:hypothetical protein
VHYFHRRLAKERNCTNSPFLSSVPNLKLVTSGTLSLPPTLAKEKSEQNLFGWPEKIEKLTKI